MAGVPPPPPRQLEVRRFGAARSGELRSLHAAVSARLDGGGGGRSRQQPRSARRRTTGHLPRKRRRGGTGEEGGAAARKEPPRRVRRRRELAGNPAEGFSVAGDGARRLRTHLWHAKRFSMERRWGFVLPVAAQGRGRGLRSVLKKLKTGTIIHDASYLVPVELDGPEGSLLSVLGMVLSPAPTDKTSDSKRLQDQVLRGVCYANAMLCGAGNPHSQIIGPVSYMWRPFLREHDKSEAGDLSTHHCFDEGSISSLRRQLWIWIHPSALDEGLSAIRFACEKQVLHLSCKIEINAHTSSEYKKTISRHTNLYFFFDKCSLGKINTDTSDLYTSADAPPDSSTALHLSKTSIIDHAGILHPGAILSVTVHDPREGSVHQTELSSELVSLGKENKILQEDITPNAGGAPSEVGNILSSMWMHPGQHDVFLSDCTELWDSSQSINPPVAEDVLCMEKHHERIKFFCLDSGNNQVQTTQEKDSFSRSCPVVLVKHAKEEMLTLGWSLILPLSWVKPFWLLLVSHGAHAIGLRERWWIATKFKMPCFPYDYPDSKAYALYMSKEAADHDRTDECRPASKRPPRVPMPPLWHCIRASFHKDDGILSSLKVDDLVWDNMILPENCSVNTKSGDTEPSLQLHVLRTIQMLRQYVKEFDMKYLSSSSDMEMDAEKPKLTSNGTVKLTCSLNELCLTRVLIRAFKEGSFEEGAVICAPLPSDLSAWKSRSISYVISQKNLPFMSWHVLRNLQDTFGILTQHVCLRLKKLISFHAWNRSKEEEEECLEKWELQLPQSHVSSYFSWFDPSTSSLQLPKDAAARESFRWPIGFVTTGFIHGSNGQDAVAVAFCETKLLAVLRRQQWMHENLQGQEICVLVRNARSAAYRRGLATIVLEHQESDLEFM
ncbi:hypothetical protein U9M48_001032 [Paspalum notatum var. saurae]|uniref:Uncharacterized protein n=1 Tax=Paspalum notatum var. saurae TaxID=547442 RepID=A0AAQ3SIL2_PASNO